MESVRLPENMRRRMPQLDAVRGIAILLVMFVNTSEKYPQLHLQPIVGNGWMGVDLFFVLSGFLITGILLEARDAPHYFKNFYARRALRILPLYYAILLFMFVAVPFLRPSEAHTVFAKSSPIWAYPVFLQNFLIAVPTMAAGPLGTTWSLAIEEQFYLVWPLVVRFCRPAILRRMTATMILCTAPFTYFLWKHGVLIYSNVFCRQVGLMAGALLALMLHSSGLQPGKYVKPAWILFPVALAMAFGSEALGARWLAFTMVALAAAAFLLLALYSQQAWLQAGLRNRFLRYTGKISYGLYLLHKIPVDLAQTFHLERHPAMLLPVAFAGSYALAALSWTLLERPFLRLKRFFPEAAGCFPGERGAATWSGHGR
jgi:peptidoglycan/LPS O-acetylase OafA/YrhL